MSFTQQFSDFLLLLKHFHKFNCKRFSMLIIFDNRMNFQQFKNVIFKCCTFSDYFRGPTSFPLAMEQKVCPTQIFAKLVKILISEIIKFWGVRFKEIRNLNSFCLIEGFFSTTLKRQPQFFIWNLDTFWL